MFDFSFGTFDFGVYNFLTNRIKSLKQYVMTMLFFIISPKRRPTAFRQGLNPLQYKYNK